MQGMDHLTKGMSNHRRRMLLQVSEGSIDALKILHRCVPHVRCDEILSWLIKNNLCGKKFVETVQNDWKNSVLTMMSYALMKIDGDTKMRPIYLGRDYLP